MNYFELFGLPIAFKADTHQLRNAFMHIQRASHPDKFVQGTEAEQEMALEQSAIANKGFSLLNNAEKIELVSETLLMSFVIIFCRYSLASLPDIDINPLSSNITI